MFTHKWILATNYVIIELQFVNTERLGQDGGGGSYDYPWEEEIEEILEVFWG